MKAFPSFYAWLCDWYGDKAFLIHLINQNRSKRAVPKASTFQFWASFFLYAWLNRRRGAFIEHTRNATYDSSHLAIKTNHTAVFFLFMCQMIEACFHTVIYSRNLGTYHTSVHNIVFSNQPNTILKQYKPATTLPDRCGNWYPLQTLMMLLWTCMLISMHEVLNILSI